MATKTQSWATEYRQRRLNEWFSTISQTPKSKAKEMIGLLVNSQKSIKKDYDARVLLELLQNVDDAANTAKNKNARKAKFILDGRILRILNQGKPFNEDTLENVCISHLSAKTDEDGTEEGEEEKVITTGSKGIGFRSILNWSDNVKIFSGNYAISFSKDTCTRELETNYKNTEVFQQANILKKNWIDEFPFLSIPFDTEFPSEWENGQYKDGDTYYDTCIEIILRDGKIQTYLDAMKTFTSQEIMSMLFMLKVDDISFVDNTDGQKSDIHITLAKDNNIQIINDMNYTVATIQNGDTTYKYHLFKEGTETIAVPYDWENHKKNKYKLYATFPINDQDCPFPVIMNSIAFELTSNRNSLLKVSSENPAIIQKLQDMLIKKVAPYFAQSKYGCQALEMVRYDNIDSTVFCDSVESIDKNIAHQQIIPTVDGAYRKLSDVLQKLDYDNYPEFMINYKGSKFITDDVYNLLDFSDDLLDTIELLSKQEKLYNFINEHSANWTRAQCINVLLFWLELDEVRINPMLPKLIKTKRGQFVTFDSKDHEVPFLYSGVKIDAVPEWLALDIIDEEDQKELFNQFKEAHRGQEFKESLDRVISHKYEDFFNYMDKNRLGLKINSQVNQDFGRAVDFLKFIYRNYKKDNDIRNESGDTDWNVPGANGIVTTPDQVYFGKEYDDTVGAKICVAAGLTPLPNPGTFGITGEDIDDFKRVIQGFFKIRDNILPVNAEITNSEYGSDLLKYMQKKRISGEPAIRKIISISGLYIPELKKILQNASQNLILEWLNTHILNYLPNTGVHVKFNSNNSTTIFEQNPIIYELLHENWLDVDGDKIAPVYCMTPSSKNKQTTYPAELVHYIPEYSNYKFLWDKLGVAQHFYQLPDDAFYSALLKLPDLDKTGEISEKIYKDIASISDEDLSVLDHLAESNCPEKQEFFETGQLLAKNKTNPKACYYPINQKVYFSNKKVLNLNNKPILATPSRSGSIKKFKDTLNVELYTEDITADYAACHEHADNAEFSKYFNDFKPYLYALKTTELLHNAIANLTITLVDSVKLSGQSNYNNDIDDYYPINAKNNRFCVYLDKNTSLDNSAIAAVVGEICDLVSNSSKDISDSVTVLYLLGTHEKRIKWLIDKGCDIDLLAEYKDIKQHFIDIIKSISPDADMSVLINKIDFENFTHKENLPYIRDILNWLNTDVDTFEAQGFHYIDFRTDNKAKLNSYIESNRTKYAEYLYNTLFDKSIEEQEKFETERYQFERNLPEIPNTHNFDPANILPIPEYKNTHPFSDNITRENHEKLKKLCPRPEQLAELLSKEVNYSLLSFGHIDLLKERYDKLVEQNEKLSETDTEFDPLKTDVQILEMEVYTPTETTNKQPQNHTALHQKNTQKAKHQYSAKADIQKQKHGFEAELHAYHTLKDMYGEKNVRWLSGNAVKAGVLIGGGDDSLGYDMTYTDSDGNVQFVEVKSATHIGGDTYSFILTDNEEQTATENIDNYSIFLVIDDKIKVITADALIHNLLPNAKTDQKTVFYP